jgi:multiple sugar transport system permease protein
VIAILVSDLFVFHNLMMAICLIALAPSVILVLLRCCVVEGLSTGAMKG